ncbi:MAG: hypothetical protein M4579_000882 [Chaenotheca gracillima]|nr:MAG: hypothetical protein M4579_000882 [Chaenotheca gracillima]
MPTLPLTPPASRPGTPPKITVQRPSTPPDSPPTRPLPWLWTCHLCHSTYSLGVTRRCVHDGHYFCSGVTIRKDGTTRRHASCNSEFDYVGWSGWSEWRRETLNKSCHDVVKDCWHHCDYPSECRWGTKIGVKAKKFKKTIKEEKKAEVPSPPKTDLFRNDATDDIVEQVVSIVPRKSHKSVLSPIREDDELLSPTSPLRQHYTLPPIPDMSDEMDMSWDDQTDQDTHDSAPGARAGAISIMLEDDDHPRQTEEEFLPSVPEESIDLSDFMDDYSESGSDPGDSPNEERTSDTSLSFFDLKSASYTVQGLELPREDILGFKARKESYDSGYGSDEGEAETDTLSSDGDYEEDNFIH